jgi:hypothetical protein
VMCASCEKDRFYFQGTCDIPCADIEPMGAVTVFAILAVTLVWTLINLSAGGLYASPPHMCHRASVRVYICTFALLFCIIHH